MAKVHYLKQVAADIDKTHKGLGRMTAAAMLAVKSHKVMLNVSPRGCGKSTVTAYIAEQAPKALVQDRISVSGLMALQAEFSGFNGVVVIDDIAKTGTRYSRIATITSLAELVSSGYIHSSMSKMHFDITEFKGSALINIQPVLLRHLVQSDEWEASVQDKSFRYYHLQRPGKPNPEPPGVKLTWGVDLDEVAAPELKGQAWETLRKVLSPQWGLSRLQKHGQDLLRAAAALDGRKAVKIADYAVLTDVLASLRLEDLVMEKRGFESGRNLHSARLAILTEFETHGQFTLEQVCEDYKLSASQGYRLMSEQIADWRVVAQHPTTYAPSESLKKEFIRLGFNHA